MHSASAVRRRDLLRFALFLPVLFATLLLPVIPEDISAASFAYLPVELPILAALLLLLRGPAFAILRGVVTVLFAVTLFLKLADIATQLAFWRPFNPVFDATILWAGWHLISGTLGLAEACAIVAGAVVALALLTWAVHWSMGAARRLPQRGLRIAAIALSLLGLGALAVQAATDTDLRTEAPGLPFLAARVVAMRDALADLAVFEKTLADDPVATIPPERLLSGLKGHDVVVLFVESYGRITLEDPEFAAVARPRLQAIEADLATHGMHAASGWLTSSTFGGQSWLAHGALFSGLWTTDQQRYDGMLISNRRPLNRLFAAAGWHTQTLMPAITMGWPAERYYGYDRVFTAPDLGYRGLPFNWMPMPDQYTLSAYRRLRAARDKPTMTEIALLSSHAPWTPLPTLLPWDSIGDGSVFTAERQHGDPPAVVWQHPARVRAQYIRSIDYTLKTIGSFMSRYGKGTLFIILGDHQPPVVTSNTESRDVPIHMVSDDPAVLASAAGWGWTTGMQPAADAPVWRMDGFRERFVAAFSSDRMP